MIPWIGASIVAIMILQHWLVDTKKENANNWPNILHFYRNTMRLAVIVPAFFVFGSVIVLIMDTGKLISEIMDFFTHKGPLTVLFLAFFGGVLRLFAERAVGGQEGIFGSLSDLLRSFFAPSKLRADSSIGKISNAMFGPQHDAWFGWLCVSLGVAFLSIVVTDVLPPSDASIADVTINASSSGDGPNTLLWFIVGLVSVIYVAIGYFLWIYMVLFSKLTEQHHLTSRSARLFLGGLFRDQIPRQTVLIGPPHSGKTHFCKQTGARDAEARDNTTRIDIRIGSAFLDGTTFQLTTLDTPGENMGDHVFLASIFRSDTLVFVLDMNMLDVEQMQTTSNYNVQDWHNFIVESDEEAIRQTRQYMQGFTLATNRSSDGTLFDSEKIFKVRAFTLFLNAKSPEVFAERRRNLDSNNVRWQALARELGNRFGVPPEDCCCIAGNAGTPGEGLFLLAYSTHSRLRNSAWPGRTLDDRERRLLQANERGEGDVSA